MYGHITCVYICTIYIYMYDYIYIYLVPLKHTNWYVKTEFHRNHPNMLPFYTPERLITHTHAFCYVIGNLGVFWLFQPQSPLHQHVPAQTQTAFLSLSPSRSSNNRVATCHSARQRREGNEEIDWIAGWSLGETGIGEKVLRCRTCPFPV